MGYKGRFNNIHDLVLTSMKKPSTGAFGETQPNIMLTKLIVYII